MNIFYCALQVISINVSVTDINRNAWQVFYNFIAISYWKLTFADGLYLHAVFWYLSISIFWDISFCEFFSITFQSRILRFLLNYIYLMSVVTSYFADSGLTNIQMN